MEHLYLGREGLAGKLTSVTVIAALFAVVVTAIGIEAATMGIGDERREADAG